LIFKNKLRTIPALAEGQITNFQIKNKYLQFNVKQQVPYNQQTTFCFMLIYVQLWLPEARELV